MVPRPPRAWSRQRFTRPGTLLLLVTLLLGLPGCMFFTTKDEGKTLRVRIDTLVAQSTEQKKRELKLQAQLAELKRILPTAQALLLKNAARFGVRLDELAGLVGRIQGRLETSESNLGGANGRLKTLQGQVAKLSETLVALRLALAQVNAELRRAPPSPRDVAEHFAKANLERLAGRYPEARRLYLALRQKYPKDPRAEASWYWTAQTYFKSYNYKQTVVTLAALLKALPTGRYAARARLLSSRSYFELKWCRTAMRVAGLLIRKFPHSEVAPDGHRLLARLQKLQHVKGVCLPGK